MSLNKIVDIQRDGADIMRDGPLMNVKTEFGAKHPVEEMLKSTQRNKVKTKREMLAATYGSYLPMAMMMEQQVLSSFHRLPGLESEFAGLETLAKHDLDIDFHDIYGKPDDSPDLPTTDLHHEMEKILKL